MGLGGIDNIGAGAPAFNVPGQPSETGTTGTVSPSHADDIGNVDETIRQMVDRGPDVDGARALRNAQVEDLGRELRDMVPARHTLGKFVGNFFKRIGRAVMQTCHAIRNTFAFAPPKRSRAEFQAALESRHPEAYAQGARSRVGTWTSRPGNLYSCGTDVLGAAMGLRENIRVKPFTDAEIEAIRKGQFKLTDIVQDPNFENCWFLGTLVSFLTAKGPGAIQELISLPPLSGNRSGDAPLTAQVKLGGEVYDVPLGELRDDRGSGVSASAPWVRLMETAMQMHLLNLHEKGVVIQGFEKVVNMAFGIPGLALHSLLGQGVTSYQRGKPMLDPRGVSVSKMNVDSLLLKHQKDNAQNVTRGDCVNELVEKILDARQNGRSVMLTTSGSRWTSLGVGLSPNHTVSIQDVVRKKDGTAYFQILDPYNRSVSISSDILLNGGGVVMEKAPDAQALPRLQRRDSLASTTARLDASVDGPGNDF